MPYEGGTKITSDTLRYLGGWGTLSGALLKNSAKHGIGAGHVEPILGNKIYAYDTGKVIGKVLEAILPMPFEIADQDNFILEEGAPVTTAIEEIGEPLALGEPQVGMTVAKTGARTGYTKGTYREIGVDARVWYGVYVATIRDCAIADIQIGGGDSNSFGVVGIDIPTIVGHFFAGNEQEGIGISYNAKRFIERGFKLGIIPTEWRKVYEDEAVQLWRK